MAGQSDSINELTLKELQSIPLSQYGMKGQVPTLEELIQLSQGKIRLLIELKAVSEREKEPLVDQILALIEKYDFQKDCILMSLDYELVQLVRQKNPALKTGYCMFGNLGETTVENLLSLDCDFVVIEENMVSNSFISACRQAWLPVYVWTVELEENMRKYLDMGVNGLISDKPYLVKEVLEDAIHEKRQPYLKEYQTSFLIQLPLWCDTILYVILHYFIPKHLQYIFIPGIRLRGLQLRPN